ncbi:MAG: ribosome-associated translation inhibitor RaiA [Bacteriovoracaceae bacterium]|nr:ribosome-associated translation inhibitor RaiA [Bacteriovoracaceae bacterium]
MSLQITFRHLEHTPALDTQIREKSQKFTKWFGDEAQVHWTCWVEGNEQWSEVKVHARHKEYFAKAASADLYKTFDLVVQKIHNQME